MKKLIPIGLFFALTSLSAPLFSQAHELTHVVQQMGFHVEVESTKAESIQLAATKEQSKMRCGKKGTNAVKIPLQKRLTKSQLAAFKRKGLATIVVVDKNERLVFQVTEFVGYSKKNKSITVGISSCKRSTR